MRGDFFSGRGTPQSGCTPLLQNSGENTGGCLLRSYTYMYSVTNSAKFTYQQQGRVHHSRPVEHGSHKDVVTRAVNERHMPAGHEEEEQGIQCHTNARTHTLVYLSSLKLPPQLGLSQGKTSSLPLLQDR